tara:strand:+ start:753 stop:1685 length:933 start_codon:yes stop_codon:yes gene_type:complete
MKYIVTGGAGFIGSNLVNRLLIDEHEVIVIDNLVSKNSRHRIENKEVFDWNDKKNLTFFKADINNVNDADVFNNVDAIFHLAALPNVQLSIADPIKHHEVNINGTLNMLNACVKHQIKRFIFSSSSSIYGDPKILPSKEDSLLDFKSPYALHKVVGEHYCKLFSSLYDIETLSLRYFNVYGPGQPISGAYSPVMGVFSHQILNNEPITINGDGEQTRDFVFVDDVVNANILSADLHYDRYNEFNIGSGIEFSINKIADLFGNKLSRKYKPQIEEPRNSLADIQKAKTILNWFPKTQLVNWMEDYKLRLGI